MLPISRSEVVIRWVLPVSLLCFPVFQPHRRVRKGAWVGCWRCSVLCGTPKDKYTIPRSIVLYQLSVRYWNWCWVSLWISLRIRTVRTTRNQQTRPTPVVSFGYKSEHYIPLQMILIIEYGIFRYYDRFWIRGRSICTISTLLDVHWHLSNAANRRG